MNCNLVLKIVLAVWNLLPNICIIVKKQELWHQAVFWLFYTHPYLLADCGFASHKNTILIYIAMQPTYQYKYSFQGHSNSWQWKSAHLKSLKRLNIIAQISWLSSNSTYRSGNSRRNLLDSREMRAIDN